MEIDGWVVDAPSVEDAVQVVIQILGDDEGVAGLLQILALDAPVEDQAGAGVVHAVDGFRRILAACFGLLDQLGDCIGEVRVAHDIVGGDGLACDLDAADPAVRRQDAMVCMPPWMKWTP